MTAPMFNHETDNVATRAMLCDTSPTYRLDLPEPLTMEDQLLVQVLTQRYEGVECPFLTFSRDGFTTVVYPRTVRGKIPQLGANPNANQIPAEASSPVRIPNGAGAING